MYLADFGANVVSAQRDSVVLDRTAFNPKGGGLVSDTGSINTSRVSEVTKEGEEVIHIVQDASVMKPGDAVRGLLDWERRHRVMRMHTAAHMLSSIVNVETGALITGNQIKPDESRVDFNLDEFDRDRMSYFIDKVNQAAARNLDVTAYFMKREEVLATPGLVKLANAMPPSLEVLRIVKIGDVDTQADGGVHVRNTNEIGRLVGLRTENKGRNNRRLYFAVE